jgi:SRSO17 transposase
MERMEQAVPDTNEQALQHFISNSPWDAEAVMRQVALCWFGVNVTARVEHYADEAMPAVRV